MPDPSTPNRERLLRLIDGGTQALNELNREEPAKPASAKTPDAALAQWKARMGFWTAGRTVRLAQAALLVAALLAGLFYGIQILKTLGRPSPAAPAAVPAAAPSESAALEDASGTGLRLVGVDSSVPAVALLEDLKTGKTYFAKVGDRVKDARVKEILKNKVQVQVRGKTVELS